MAAPVTNPPSLQITGISVDIKEPLSRSLFIELNVDGTASSSVLLERKERPIGEIALRTILNLDQKSMLTVQVTEKHYFRQDKPLARFNISLENLWQSSQPNQLKGHSKKYRIHLKGSKNQIWLNINVVQNQAENPLKDKIDNAVAQMKEFKTVLDRMGWGKHVLNTGLKLANALSELNSIAGVVVACVEVACGEMDAHDQARDEIQELAESVARLVNYIQPVKEIAELNELKKTLERFPNLVTKTVNLIEELVKQNVLLNLAINPYNKERIDELNKEHTVFKEEFARGIEIDTAVKVNSLARAQDMEELENYLLKGIKKVDPLATECLEGTREDILADVAAKVDDLDGPNVIWIRGAPGSGKSSISLTTKSRLRQRGRLVTYFRFDRSQANSTTTIALWRQVGCDLARRIPHVRMRLQKQLRDDSLDIDLCMSAFRSLVEAPLLELTSAPSAQSHVIVIDALDECGGRHGRTSSDRQALLQTLRRWPQLPKYFKLIVTSREEEDIGAALSSISATIHIPSGHVNDSGDQEALELIHNASKDIRTFFDHHFASLRSSFSALTTDWPGKKTTDDMVHRAAGNFMWATTVMGFISSGPPNDRLQSLMSRSEGMKGLFALYSSILDISFGEWVLEQSKAKLLRAVLAIIVFAQRPILDIAWTKFPITLSVDETTVAEVTKDIGEFIQKGLYSILARGSALQFIHKSFDDFLLSSECPEKYRISIDESHGILTKLCLTTMTTELRFNMCNLETSCLMNEEVPDMDKKVEDGISGLLSYSCFFWSEHLNHTPFTEELLLRVSVVLQDKLLFWFEAMSLTQEIYRVSHALLLALDWMKSASDENLKNFLRDARHFIRAFGLPIAQSAAHIYISALPFAPESSFVAKHFLQKFPQILTLTAGKPMNWSPCVFTSNNHESWIPSVTFSPNAKTFVAVSASESGGRLCICDSETGTPVFPPVVYPRDIEVYGEFFDPDGRRIWANNTAGQIVCWDTQTMNEHLTIGVGDITVGCRCLDNGPNIISVSDKGAVTLWSGETGKRLQELNKIPSNELTNYIFDLSCDGRYMASARKGDMTIWIWNLIDGCRIEDSADPHGHTAPVSTISFSIEGGHVVSGSSGGTVLISDARTGKIVNRLVVSNKREVLAFASSHNLDMVSAVAYSHNLDLLVFAEFHTGMIFVWKASTHEAILGPLGYHRSAISAIALSLDGQRVLSGSRDGIVSMWDLGGEGILQPALGTNSHSGVVQSIAFTPCGKWLISCGMDKTIRVWDAGTGKPLRNPITLVDPASDIVVSAGGDKIVAYDDGTLKMWDMDTGMLACQQNLEDDKDHWHYLAFRSTDHRLVVCSIFALRIYCLEDGVMTEEFSVPNLQPQGEPPFFYGLSPNGLTTLTYDQNRSQPYYLRSTTTGQTFHSLPEFPDLKKVTSSEIAFSPGGRYLAIIFNYPVEAGQVGGGACNAEGDEEQGGGGRGEAETYNGAETSYIRVWNCQTAELIANFPVGSDTRGLAVSPYGCHIAFGIWLPTSVSLSFRLYNALTGCYVDSGPWSGHVDEVYGFAFSEDGNKLASGSDDGQIRIWDIADLVGDSRSSMGILSNCMRMDDGWIVAENKERLLWVPSDHRGNFPWGRTVTVIGGGGTPMELDLTRFRYGEKWVECYEVTE